jgi:hypothetical protein
MEHRSYWWAPVLAGFALVVGAWGSYHGGARVWEHVRLNRLPEPPQPAPAAPQGLAPFAVPTSRPLQSAAPRYESFATTATELWTRINSGDPAYDSTTEICHALLRVFSQEEREQWKIMMTHMHEGLQSSETYVCAEHCRTTRGGTRFECDLYEDPSKIGSRR